MKRVLLVLVSVGMLSLTGAAWGQSITRVSVDSAGIEGDKASGAPDVSADGKLVVFESEAANLVIGDTGGMQDVFLHDRTTGVTLRVSERGGIGGDAESGRPAISADGSTVVFESLARNLVVGDMNSRWDIFSYDVATGVIRRASLGSVVEEANGDSREPAVSDDGSHVAFYSDATNLHINDHNLFRDVFVRDMGASVTHLASFAGGGMSGDGDSGFFTAVALSGDGRRVAFISSASNLVLGDTNGFGDIFLTDLSTSLVQRVSITTAGTEGNSSCRSCDISSDGLLVAFDSAASNMVAGDMNGAPDVFLRDTVAGTTRRVSVSSSGTEGNAYSRYPALSGDGSVVAFESAATNLVAPDLNGATDVFSREVASGEVTRVSEGTGGIGANGGSTGASLNLDGTLTVFGSDARNLVAGDMNSVSDVFAAAASGGPCNVGSSYCEGSTGNCPGGILGAADHGCPNSNPNGNGAELVPTGCASFSADTYGFAITDGAPSKPGILIQGAASIGYPTGNPTVPDSAGLFCVAPQLRGSVFFTDASGAASRSNFQGMAFGATAQAAGSTTYNQYWFRDPGNPNANPGGGAEFNFSNAVETVWIP